MINLVSMDIIIQSSLKTLLRSKFLLEQLIDDELANASVSPYYSSIGTHIRHILDFYDCIFNISEDEVIDLTARSRNKDVESKCCNAKDYLSTIVEKLETYNSMPNKMVTVIDDLGMGKIEIPYNIASLFAQANSHTIHHYAIISYILEGLHINFEDVEFGYNPTTPREIVSS